MNPNASTGNGVHTPELGFWNRTRKSFLAAVAAGPGVVGLVGPEGSGKTRILSSFTEMFGSGRTAIRTVRDTPGPEIVVDIVDDVDFDAVDALSGKPMAAIVVLSMRPEVEDMAVRRFPGIRIVRMESMSADDVRRIIDSGRDSSVPGSGAEPFTIRACVILDRLAGGNPGTVVALVRRSREMTRASGAARVSGEDVQRAFDAWKSEMLSRRMKADIAGRPVPARITVVAPVASPAPPPAPPGPSHDDTIVSIAGGGRRGLPAPSFLVADPLPEDLLDPPEAPPEPVVEAVEPVGPPALRIRLRISRENLRRKHDDMWGMLTSSAAQATRMRRRPTRLPWATAFSVFLLALLLVPVNRRNTSRDRGVEPGPALAERNATPPSSAAFPKTPQSDVLAEPPRVERPAWGAEIPVVRPEPTPEPSADTRRATDGDGSAEVASPPTSSTAPSTPDPSPSVEPSSSSSSVSEAQPSSSPTPAPEAKPSSSPDASSDSKPPSSPPAPPPKSKPSNTPTSPPSPPPVRGGGSAAHVEADRLLGMLAMELDPRNVVPGSPRGDEDARTSLSEHLLTLGRLMTLADREKEARDLRNKATSVRAGDAASMEAAPPVASDSSKTVRRRTESGGSSSRHGRSRTSDEH